jgi:hypothetical protein
MKDKHVAPHAGVKLAINPPYTHWHVPTLGLPSGPRGSKRTNQSLGSLATFLGD